MDVQRVFGCGIDRQTFKAKYEGLQEKDRLRLERAARRLWLTLKLRYEVAFYRSPFAWSGEEFHLTNVELPSIEIYLLCTCLDTLAGRPDYKDFGEWLQAQENVAGLDVDRVTGLYDRYKEEYGVGRNLRNLFENLPQSVKAWLANNVVIRRSNQPLATTGQDTNVLAKQLYIYFYEIWRNTFTHSSVSQQTLTAEDVIEPAEGDGWWVTPAACTHFVLYKDRPNQEWNLSYRQGLDLATIMRVIIHAAALKMLDIEPTQEHIGANLRNLSRLNALYAFVNEVNSNSIAMGAWSKLDERSMDEFCSYLIHVGIPNLSSKASTIMADRYNSDNGLESGLRQMTLQYLNEVEQINSTVSAFNKSHPPSKSNLDERWQLIKEFLDGLVKMSIYTTILKWPSIVEMTNVWLVIRDPCYT